MGFELKLMDNLYFVLGVCFINILHAYVGCYTRISVRLEV